MSNTNIDLSDLFRMILRSDALLFGYDSKYSETIDNIKHNLKSYSEDELYTILTTIANDQTNQLNAIASAKHLISYFFDRNSKNSDGTNISEYFQNIVDYYGDESIKFLYQLGQNPTYFFQRQLFERITPNEIVELGNNVDGLYENILSNLRYSARVFGIDELYSDTFIKPAISNLPYETVLDSLKKSSEISEDITLYRNNHSFEELVFKLEESNSTPNRIKSYERAQKIKSLYPLISEYLSSDVSKESFCKARDINLDLFNEALLEISNSDPEKKAEIERASLKAQEKFFGYIKTSAANLLDGSLSVKDFAHNNSNPDHIHRIIAFAEKDSNQGEQMILTLLRGMANDDFGFMDFKRLFSDEYNYSKIMDSIYDFKGKYLSRLSPSPERNSLLRQFNSKLKKFQKYEKPVDISILKGTTFIKIDPDTREESHFTPTKQTIIDAFILAKYDDEFYSHRVISDYCKDILYGKCDDRLDKAREVIKSRKDKSTRFIEDLEI